MVFILVGQDILSTKLLVGQNLLFCPFLVIKVPIIGGAAAHPAPPITPSLSVTYVAIHPERCPILT